MLIKVCSKNSLWYHLAMPIGLARVLVLSENMSNCARPTGLTRIFVLSEAFTDSAINALLLLTVTIDKMGHISDLWLCTECFIWTFQQIYAARAAESPGRWEDLPRPAGMKTKYLKGRFY